MQLSRLRIGAITTGLVVGLSACSPLKPQQITSGSVSPTPVPVPTTGSKSVSPSIDEQGFNLYSVEKLGLSFYFPPDWTVSYDSFASPNYLELSDPSSRLQVYYNQVLEYQLTADQKSRAAQTLNTVINVDQRQISANEVVLNDGGMILTFTLPSKGKKPPLSVWFTTKDRSQSRQNILHLLETLRINR